MGTPSGPILVDLGFFFLSFNEFWYDAKAAGWYWNGSSLEGLVECGRWVIPGGRRGEEGKWGESKVGRGEEWDWREW